MRLAFGSVSGDKGVALGAFHGCTKFGVLAEIGTTSDCVPDTRLSETRSCSCNSF